MEQYGLENLNSELVNLRQTNGESLRSLTDYINGRVLRAALDSEDVDVSQVLYGAVTEDTAVSTLYEVLTNEDVPSDREARVRTRLSQSGVDVEAVESSWVTHPTVGRHFGECLEIDTSQRPQIDLDGAEGTIEWARAQCRQIITETFSRLRNAGIIDTGPIEATVTVQVSCKECGATYRARSLLTRQECECGTE